MFSAQEAVDYGLADQVIVSRKANSIARAKAA
jgi:ATP-dependent protease ClpP protease subunit